MFISYSATAASMRKSRVVDDKDLSLGRKNICFSSKFLICSYSYSNSSLLWIAVVWWQFLVLSLAKQIYLDSRELQGAHVLSTTELDGYYYFSAVPSKSMS